MILRATARGTERKAAPTITQKRERKHRKSIAVLTPVNGSFNRHSSIHRNELAQRCAFEAVASGFKWLSLDEIRKPPRQRKDAQLARQIAIHIMAVELGVEQRHIARMQGRQRTSIHFALQTVEQRLECAVFAGTYETMKKLALLSFGSKLEATI